MFEKPNYVDENVFGPPRFKRKGPFRYFDLPIEIRKTILELLLVRGTVALTHDVAIRERFRHWDHERPQWVLLSGLCRQMQKEASDVVYSTKNTFFVRGGDVGWSIPRPFPPLKRLDVNFDMRDIFENSAYTLDCVKSWHDRLDRTPGVTPFEELTDAERWNLLHEEKLEGIWHVWSTKMSTCTTMNDLDLLRLDLTNCRCPAGCCRMGPHLLGYLEFRPDYSLPKRIEIVGIIETEKNFCKELLTEGGDIPLDHIFFVDRQGCTCREGASCDPKS